MKQKNDEERRALVQEWEKLHSDGWTYLKAAKQLGSTASSLSNWKKQFGASLPEAREIVAKSNGHDAELKQLRIENQRLKMLVAEKCLDVQALQEYAGRK